MSWCPWLGQRMSSALKDGWRFGTTNPGFRKTWSMTGNQDGAVHFHPHTCPGVRNTPTSALKAYTISIHQPGSLSGSTPSGSTNPGDFLDPMLARLSSPSGFGTDLLDFKIAAALAENNSPGNHGPYSNSDSLHFQSFTRTGTDLGINENSTEAAGDNNLKIVNPTGEGADSHEANPTRERGKSDERLTTLSEDEMLELAEMELDALRDQEALHAQVKRLPAYLKAEVDELYYEFQRQLYPLAIKNQIYAAREIFNQKGIPVKQWCKEVAEKWHTLTPEIKMKYKDYDFIKTLRGDVPVELVNGTIQTTRQVHVANTALNLGSNKRGIAFAQRWIKDMIAEMNQLAASQGIQGMLIIASFQTYIAGMAAAEEVCGGPVCTNKKIIGAKMKELLNAAGGKYFKAWPGSNVVRDLNAASIQLKVKRNAADFQVKELCQPVNTLLLDSSQRILQAIGKGWISLRYIEDGVNNSFMEEGTQHCRKIWLNCCQLTCRSYGSTVASI
ncbi:hypothetical protein Pst134EA_022517 [Puccinia striiformis f. sp. tritici]|nr:hypothetical protein Pst134EA_022517 [Puccinia striiformis f. sp. tritici]KAH9455039.1 hypothetical protein Pst134EA_022517 [Puccinia striiformis f. sp. tritici]